MVIDAEDAVFEMTIIDREKFLKKILLNKGILFGNPYNDPKYRDVIKDMKEEILKQRRLLRDTDTDNQEIHNIIKKHWND